MPVSVSEDVRAAERAAFLDSAGWGDAAVTVFPGDASTRRYFRASKGGERAILMDAPAAAETPLAPDNASPQDRHALGYNAVARLAGNNVAAFAGIAQALIERGFSAPRILAADMERGLLLIEDLGEGLYARAIPAGAHEGKLYASAVDTLAAIYRSSFPSVFEAQGRSWRVHAYDETALLAETGLYLDWYLPRFAARPSDDLRAEWEGVWQAAFAGLEAHAPGLALRDYHAENLIWLPDREVEGRTGLLDFQDALFAHPAYDLVSLIEDARRDVSPDLAEPLKDRFFKAAKLNDRASFDAAYAVLGAQRNAKILGIFVRLAERDGKARYLDLIPRVKAHFDHDLAHPALRDLAALVRKAMPEIAR
ncbi:aminoglycoside phosphotransferase family protein [Glycocaulis abyssi]|uniref:aminoglycoside phosphotransferase family protein n=1 Tax=Glycocaulis abyssi TaxID=1433403 RepID=UPI00352B36E9